jgi:hypothetical protein
MSILDEITKEKQRVTEALARVEAQREKLASQLVELESTERVLARYSKLSGARKIASARTPAQYDNETSRRQARLAEPQRSGPCPGNRQDAAGNRRRMQGGSPEPCRCRDCPAQAGRPYRRAGWKALRHAERRGLRIEKERGVSGLRWHVLKGVG